MSVGIITDSTADLVPAVKARCTVVPLTLPVAVAFFAKGE